MRSRTRKRRRIKGAVQHRKKTMDIILVAMAVFLVTFTRKMIRVFEETGAIPDTLCTCVFAALGGECGIMGWIKTTKERFRDRQYELEDREYEEKKKQDSEKESE